MVKLLSLKSLNLRVLSVLILSIALSGCNIIDMLTYKVNKQQGNITEQKHVDKLEIGMTKEQVKFLLGSPMSIDSFDHDRWDYIYTFQTGNDVINRNNLTIYFEANRLSKIEGEALINPDKLKTKTADADADADADDSENENEDEDEN